MKDARHLDASVVDATFQSPQVSVGAHAIGAVVRAEENHGIVGNPLGFERGQYPPYRGIHVLNIPKVFGRFLI